MSFNKQDQFHNTLDKINDDNKYFNQEQPNRGFWGGYLINLTSISGKKLYTWTLDIGRYLVGRGHHCDLIIDNNTVSKEHAEIEVDNEKTIKLTDTGSHNGTFVNGNMIVRTIRLHHNDIIALGNIELKLTIDDVAGNKDHLVNITDSFDDLTKAIKLPVKEALQSVTSEFANAPQIFNAFCEMGKMLVLPGPEEKMLSQGLRLLQQILPVERAVIITTEEDKEDINHSTSYVASEGCTSSFNISRTILNEVTRQKNAILISDPQTDSKFARKHSIIVSRVKSAMAVPLYDDGKMFGVLYADTTDPNHFFTKDCLKMTAVFGNILAAKMVNYRLLKERQAKEILESELSLASQIQTQLLPREYPQVDRYQLSAFQVQCQQVGGDLYDITELDDGRILFMIADVSGNGMGAALLASNILASFRILYNIRDFSIMEATCRVSKKLLEFTLTGDYATLFIGILDPSTDLLHYINAGFHNYPMIIKENGEIEYLEASGIPIGAVDIIDWKEETYKMNTGDLLIAFTDGIPEASNSNGERFGDEKLERFVVENRKQSPEQLTRSIMNKVDEFIKDTPRSDDLTMMILRREQ